MDRFYPVDRAPADNGAADPSTGGAASDDAATPPLAAAREPLGYGMRPLRVVLAELQAETVAHFRGTGTSVPGFLAEKRAAMTREM